MVRTVLSVAFVAGALALTPGAHSLFAGAEPETTTPVTGSQADQDLTTTLTDQAELSLTVLFGRLNVPPL
jgi:hypothetical protein